MDGKTWRLIETAPVRTPVVIRTLGGNVFNAIRDFEGLDDGGNSILAWRSCVEGEEPPCWSDGVCWGSNEADKPSDPPVMWMPAVHQPKEKHNESE